jgi:chloramphenicol 3-O-phosphotransferase
MILTGQIIILNGVPRSGKTSIARAMQDLGDGHWLNSASIPILLRFRSG